MNVIHGLGLVVFAVIVTCLLIVIIAAIEWLSTKLSVRAATITVAILVILVIFLMGAYT